MPRKKDTSSALLQNHIAMERIPFARTFGLVNDSELLGSAYTAMRKYAGSDWDNIEVRSIAAHDALSINERDVVLKKAFVAFGLDDKDSFHWRRLFYYLANVHFGPNQRRPGPQEVWSDGGIPSTLIDRCHAVVGVKCYRRAKTFGDTRRYAGIGGNHHRPNKTFRGVTKDGHAKVAHLANWPRGIRSSRYCQHDVLPSTR